MARHHLASFTTLWRRHERLYLEVFSKALQELARKGVVLDDEDAISETLCVVLSQVCFELSQLRSIEVRKPAWEPPIQPVSEEELKGGKARKRPDFTCNCSNRYANSAEEHEIPLHVECKRLGAPSSSSWNLNENYVNNGIKRFDSEAHEYGKRAISGLMIGYITSMNPKDILSEVNQHQRKHSPNYTDIEFRFCEALIFKTRQAIERNYVMPTQFELIHLWADFRR